MIPNAHDTVWNRICIRSDNILYISDQFSVIFKNLFYILSHFEVIIKLTKRKYVNPILGKSFLDIFAESSYSKKKTLLFVLVFKGFIWDDF